MWHDRVILCTAHTHEESVDVSDVLPSSPLPRWMHLQVVCLVHRTQESEDLQSSAPTPLYCNQREPQLIPSFLLLRQRSEPSSRLSGLQVVCAQGLGWNITTFPTNHIVLCLYAGSDFSIYIPLSAPQTLLLQHQRFQRTNSEITQARRLLMFLFILILSADIDWRHAHPGSKGMVALHFCPPKMCFISINLRRFNPQIQAFAVRRTPRLHVYTLLTVYFSPTGTLTSHPLLWLSAGQFYWMEG